MKIFNCISIVVLFTLVPLRSSHAILGGYTPDQNFYPFLDRVIKVITVASGGKGRGICTGFLLTPRTVLTAAHCIRLIHTPRGVSIIQPMYVEGGRGTSFVSDLIALTLDGEEDREYDDPTLQINDLAILFLRDNLPFSSKATISLGFDSFPEFLRPSITFGYGDTSNNSGKGLKLQAYQWGREPLRGPYTDHLTFRDPVGGPCHGDSGGPLMFWSQETQSWHLSGVIAAMDSSLFGTCSAATAFHYTSVYYHTAWIQWMVHRLYLRNNLPTPQNIFATSPPKL